MKSSHYDYLTGNYSKSVFFIPVTKIEILDIINSPNNSTSKGHDNITTNIDKECKYQFSPLLMHLVNNSLSDGYAPNDLKIAKVIPLFKSDERYLVSSYRPISLLPVFSKVFEKAVYNKFL